MFKYLIDQFRPATMCLSPGEPPLPGRDRFGRERPPEWFVNAKRMYFRVYSAVKGWMQHGCPLIPNFTMQTRSPEFVVLILSIVALTVFGTSIFSL